jgi:hypothetical protein
MANKYCTVELGGCRRSVIRGVWRRELTRVPVRTEGNISGQMHEDARFVTTVQQIHASL